MLQLKVKIVYNKKIKGDYFHLALQSPGIAKDSSPGQFLMVQVSIKHFPVPLRKSPKVIAEDNFLDIKINDVYEPLLRRPLSIHRVRGDNIELFYEVVGKATQILSHRKPGGYLDVIGPLGNGFTCPLTANRYPLAVLVAGGMGVAPLVFLAEKLRKIQNPKSKIRNLVLIGAKTKKHIICEKDFRDLVCKVKIATDDGSRGFKGKVTELLQNILTVPASQFPVTIYACGPRLMLKEISRISEEHNIPAQVSLEEHMACGIGACLGCVVNTKEGFRRVCKEGPVFDGDEIIW